MGDIQHVTVGTTVETVTLDKDYREIEVLSRDGGGEVYFTVDGADPTVKGRGCEVLPAAMGGIELTARASGITDVKLIATAATEVTVKGID